MPVFPLETTNGSALPAESARATGASSIDGAAVLPYPRELERWVDWQGTRVLLRPIRPDDAEAHLRFVRALAPDDVRYRMFMAMRELPPDKLARLTRIDYDREMAFIATRPVSSMPRDKDTPGDGKPAPRGPRTGPLTVPEADGNLLWETLGVARVVRDATRNEAEFAIIVRSDLKGHGLGNILMQHLIAYCRTRGIGAIVGESLSDNAALRRLVRRLGFTIDAYGDAGTRGLRLALSGGGGTG